MADQQKFDPMVWLAEFRRHQAARATALTQGELSPGVQAYVQRAYERSRTREVPDRLVRDVLGTGQTPENGQVSQVTQTEGRTFPVAAQQDTGQSPTPVPLRETIATLAARSEQRNVPQPIHKEEMGF